MTYSSSGVGSSGQLVAESFAKVAGIKIEHVPYKGASQGIMDLVAGHIFFSAQTVSSTAAQVRGGALARSCIPQGTRLPDFPDVPTFKEHGLRPRGHHLVQHFGPGRICPRTSCRR